MRVLGEGFTPEDEEDSALAEVSKVWAYQARYRVPLTKATAGTFLSKDVAFDGTYQLSRWSLYLAC